MASKRKEYFRRTRKSRMRDLKHSPTGILSLISALLSAACLGAAVVKSYQMSGGADYVTGSLCLVGLVLAVGGWILGALGMREPNIRPVPPKTGIALGVILTFALGSMYAYGMITSV